MERPIREGTFCNCVSLENIVLPENLRLISAYAFQGCSALSDIALPDSIEEIREVAFGGCERLEISALPACLRHLDALAFNECARITDLEISDALTEFNDFSFFDCVKTLRVSEHRLDEFLHILNESEQHELSPRYECSSYSKRDKWRIENGTIVRI